MTEQEHVDKMAPHLRPIYWELRRRALGFGPDVHVVPLKSYIRFGYFGTRRPFATVEYRNKRDKLHITVRREVQGIPEGEIGTFRKLKLTRVPGSHGWTTMPTWFEIGSMGELDDAEMLLRAAYHAAL